MPRQELTEDQVNLFKSDALDAAFSILKRKKNQNLSLREVSKKLGHSPMTIYRYFKNYDYFIAELRTKAFTRFADAQMNVVKTELSDLRNLNNLVREYIDFAMREPQSYRLMFFS
jgi:AcrR family transcriptional regulator